jgi:hypothetical protein
MRSEGIDRPALKLNFCSRQVRYACSTRADKLPRSVCRYTKPMRDSSDGGINNTDSPKRTAIKLFAESVDAPRNAFSGINARSMATHRPPETVAAVGLPPHRLGVRDCLGSRARYRRRYLGEDHRRLRAAEPMMLSSTAYGKPPQKQSGRRRDP